MIQGSDEWFAARLGKVTASRISDCVAKTAKGAWGATRSTYMGELIVERLTGERGNTFTNQAMEWGTAKEPEARAAYEFRYDASVVEVGFVEHPLIPMAGASPDGLQGDNGLIEIKCPFNSKAHIETLLRQAPPPEYLDQMQWQLACTDRQWVDFISFDPRMPESMSLYVHRVQRDSKRIAELETMVREFLAELDAKVAELKAIYDRKVAA